MSNHLLVGTADKTDRFLQLAQVPFLLIDDGTIAEYGHMYELELKVPQLPKNIIKADGPERIEQEWWIQEGAHRDYFAVEDEEGCRYWLFREGHYDEQGNVRWWLHGIFA